MSSARRKKEQEQKELAEKQKAEARKKREEGYSCPFNRHTIIHLLQWLLSLTMILIVSETN